MKLRANEYCACIGYNENKAIVNKKAARCYKSYDVSRFLAEGLYKQAFSLAYYRRDETQMQEVLHTLQNAIQKDEQTGHNIPQSIADMTKLFGNIPAPQNLSGILYV